MDTHPAWDTHSDPEYSSDVEQQCSNVARLSRQRQTCSQAERQAQALFVYRQTQVLHRRLREETEGAKLRQALEAETSWANQHSPSRASTSRAAQDCAAARTETGTCTLWQQHEDRWAAFEHSPPDPVRIANIPWPPDAAGVLEHMATSIMSTVNSSGGAAPAPDTVIQAYRAAFLRASMRWHPDKFAHKFSKWLAEADRDEVASRVQHISQMLNTQWATMLGKSGLH
ncbi:hypothetical protein WJX72_003189 [[Myrmecia] bisecta]|uniref:Uncharacterized protein n=1 Tax=[Myrmecia] bisecta TaxID=41462 RepID=A0AAW1PVX0_9CHLO